MFLANSVSSVTASTEALWQQRNSRASASPGPSTRGSCPDGRPPTGPGQGPAAPLTSRVCSAAWKVSMSWMTNGWRGEGGEGREKEVKRRGGGERKRGKGEAKDVKRIKKEDNPTISLTPLPFLLLPPLLPSLTGRLVLPVSISLALSLFMLKFLM